MTDLDNIFNSPAEPHWWAGSLNSKIISEFCLRGDYFRIYENGAIVRNNIILNYGQHSQKY